MEKFCEYLNEKCEVNGQSIRKIAMLSDISHPYLLDLIKGRKAPPDIKTQINIVCALELDKDASRKFFDLAATERR